MKKIFLIGLIAIIAATGVSVAYSSIPDTSGVIHSCYKTSGAFKGQVRIIDNASESCEAAETGLNWSQNPTVGYEIVAGSTVNVTSNNFNTASATCPSGKKAVGGGFGDTGTNLVYAVASYPSADDTWTVKMFNNAGSTGTVAPYAVCVSE